MKEGRKGPPRATSRPGSPCGPCYASRRPPLIPSAPSRTLPPLPSSSRSLSSPSVYINLGRLHLYLMLPISSLILLPPLTSAPSLSHLRGLHLAFFISRETHHPAESRSVRHAAPQVHPVNPGRGGGFIVPPGNG